MLLDIWIGVVMVLFCLLITVPWYCLDWSSRVFGFNIFTLIQEGSYYVNLIGPVVLFLGLAPNLVLRRWVRREKKAVAQGKRPCLHCGYDLRAHELGSTCPECGNPFEMPEIEDYFRNLSDSGRSTSVTKGRAHRRSA